VGRRPLEPAAPGKSIIQHIDTQRTGTSLQNNAHPATKQHTTKDNHPKTNRFLLKQPLNTYTTKQHTTKDNHPKTNRFLLKQPLNTYSQRDARNNGNNGVPDIPQLSTRTQRASWTPRKASGKQCSQ